jgi:hypothetical protein
MTSAMGSTLQADRPIFAMRRWPLPQLVPLHLAAVSGLIDILAWGFQRSDACLMLYNDPNTQQGSPQVYGIISEEPIADT